MAQQVSYAQKCRQAAGQYITTLHEGALLVRLKTRVTTIETMRQHGLAKRADKIERIQTEENRKIIIAFREYFDFCPVYFFYSDYSQHVTNGAWSEVAFVNDSGHIDSSIIFDGRPFLMAEFANIQADTMKYFAGHYMAADGKRLERREAFRSGPGFEFHALVVKNKNFVQIAAPFPYYVRTICLLPLLRRRPKAVVRVMDHKLQNYYEKVRKHESKDVTKTETE